MEESENYVKLIPPTAAIKEACLDFGDGAKYAATHLTEVTGLSECESYWEGTRLHFLTESIQPEIKSPTRPRAMLLFSNPHPQSVRNGLFMSEKHSIRFWEILCPNLGINNRIRWDDKNSIQEMVTLLMNGNYEGPLLFFECLYQIPSKSPEVLRKLFENTDDFRCYLHAPSLARIKEILSTHNIKSVLVFKGDTFESIVGKRGISKGSRQTLRSAVKNAAGDERLFWECMDKHELRKQVPDLKHECIAIKVMDTRVKNATFLHVLDYALQYASIES